MFADPTTSTQSGDQQHPRHLKQPAPWLIRKQELLALLELSLNWAGCHCYHLADVATLSIS